MAVATLASALVSGTVTTWAGVTRVTTSPHGVRAVELPSWRDGQPGPLGEPEITVESGDPAAERHLRHALAELADYFAGRRQEFTATLDPAGTPFYRGVWDAVAAVPYGETRSYQEIAREVGAPAAVRAVGGANGANPVAPFVPCHRIVGSDGRLHGYGPGLPLKHHLLVMEGAIPASAEDTLSWLDQLAVRLGTDTFFLGSRATRVYCRPGCPSLARGWDRPRRFFRAPGEPEAAGYRPCAACRPDAA
jgi:O-6-methylguanine DNA methyltransferase